jgi:hypothetical protein
VSKKPIGSEEKPFVSRGFSKDRGLAILAKAHNIKLVNQSTDWRGEQIPLSVFTSRIAGIPQIDLKKIGPKRYELRVRDKEWYTFDSIPG